MIIADFECPSGHITEHICHAKQKRVNCKCGKKAKRIISLGRVDTGNEYPSWLKSVLEVVDKTNPAKHVQDFASNPSRRNYKTWMKGEGIKPLDHTEHGAPPVFRKPPELDTKSMVDRLTKMRMERNRIEVR